MNSIVFIISLSVIGVSMADTVKDSCPFDYTPCDCSSYQGGDFFVYCTGVQVEDIQSAFQRTSIQIHRGIQLSGNYKQLPANLLANKTVEIVIIDCRTLFRLEFIDPDAFRSSQSSMTDLELTNCELIGPEFNWNFLSGFTAVKFLSIYNGPLYTLQSMPYLPSLQGISIESTGFRQWHPPAQTPNLYEIGVRKIGAENAQVIESIMDSIAYYNNTLLVLTLWDVGLTGVPSQMKSFNRLLYWTIEQNKIPLLSAGSITLTSNGYLRNNGINYIEPGALQGDLSKSIDLSYNNLTAFDESVFRSLLESSGSVTLRGNPVNCDCSVAWIIRDNPQFLPRVSEGYCANLASPFEDLNPDQFANCP